MIRKTLLLSFVAVATFVYSQSFTKKQFDEDLDILKTELPKRHKNLYAKLTEKDFLAKVESIKEKTGTMDLPQFEVELYKLMKSIDDEHTHIEPPFKTTYPVRFDYFKEGIFVTKSDSIHQDLIGKKLEGIGKKSTKEITNEFQYLIKSDNEGFFKISALNFLHNPYVLSGLRLSDSPQKISYQLGDTSVNIEAFPIENFKVKRNTELLRDSKKDIYWSTLIDNGKTIYFNYQECAEDPSKPFEVFTKDLFNQIDSKKPLKIIIDLRNNSGGNSAVLKPFLDMLKDSYLNKKGSLFVLIGKKTFSSALMNAVELKRNYKSILVGEETSGNVNHYGEVRGFQLPNSKIIVGYSTKYWEVWQGYKGGLKPDYKIEYSIYKFKNNQDEAVDFITKYK